MTAPVPQTLAGLLEEYLTTQRNLGEKTAERYGELACYLDPRIAALAYDDDSLPLVLTREWSRLKDGGGHKGRQLSRKTVAGVRGVLSSAYQWAKTLWLATSNPALASILPRAEPKKEALALSPTHLNLVLNSSTHWALPVFLDVCADLGARRGEVLALRWLDSAEGIMRIGRSLSQTKKGLHFEEPKSAAGFRYVPIPETTMATLERRRAEQALFREHYGPLYRADLDPIFCEENGEALKPNTVSAEVSRLCKKLKLPKGASLHTLRHTHASHLLANGEPLTEVSKRLGHSSPEVTARIYAHAIEGRGRELADAWDRIRNGLKNPPASTPPIHHHGKPVGKRERKVVPELRRINNLSQTDSPLAGRKRIRSR